MRWGGAMVVPVHGLLSPRTPYTKGFYQTDAVALDHLRNKAAGRSKSTWRPSSTNIALADRSGIFVTGIKMRELLNYLVAVEYFNKCPLVEITITREFYLLLILAKLNPGKNVPYLHPFYVADYTL